MTLSNTKIQNAKPKNKSYRLWDEKGLYLEVTPSGGKLWRFKYRIGSTNNKKEKRSALGTYPEITLAAARELRDRERSLLAQGIDPSEHKKARKRTEQNQAQETFEAIARQWHLGQSREWSESHIEDVIRRLELHVFPHIGDNPITKITAPEILEPLRGLETAGKHETAHRCLGIIQQVYKYAVSSGLTERNIASDLKGALQPVKKKHLPAIIEPDRVGALLRMLDSYSGTAVVQAALKLAPLVFVRPGELRKARWADINLSNKQWSFPASKTAQPHIVPLARQALKILENIKPLTGRWEYVFPGARSRERPMSDNAVLSALRRMHIGKDEMCGHGFRAMARTILDEELGFRPDIVDHQLAHQVKDPNGRAYNRTSHLRERTEMMQAWADYLEVLKSGG